MFTQRNNPNCELLRREKDSYISHAKLNSNERNSITHFTQAAIQNASVCESFEIKKPRDEPGAGLNRLRKLPCCDKLSRTKIGKRFI